MNSLAQRRMAIVGGGAAGVAMFIAAVQRGTAERIFVVEPGVIGSGAAFSPPDHDLICNTSVDIMSIVPGKPLDFLEYLTANGHAATAESFVPRRIYGDYLADRFHRYARLARARGIEVTHVPYRFRALKRLGHRRYALELEGVVTAAAVVVSDVVFCIGAGSPRLPEAFAPHRGHPHLVRCPYDEAEMRTKVPPRSQVLVIGSKLSAVDATLLLCRAGHRVTMLSPSGRLPSVRARFMWGNEVPIDADGLLHAMTRWDGPADAPLPGALGFGYRKYFARAVRACTGRSWRAQFSRAERADQRLREDIAIAEHGGTAWQDWVVKFVNTANSLYLDYGERRIGGFHPAFGSLLFEYLTAAALPNARKILRYLESGQLTVERGEPRDVAAEQDGPGSWRIDWGRGERRFDAVVNAAGFHAPCFVLNANGEIEVQSDGRRAAAPIRASTDLSARIPQWGDTENIWLTGASLQGRLLTASAIFIITNLADRIAAAMLRPALRSNVAIEPRAAGLVLAPAAATAMATRF